MLLLLISLVAGALTVLAPCVLPLLPVIVGGSLSGKSRQTSRPYIIAASLAASVISFTLLLKATSALGGISQTTLDYISGGIIIGLGIVTAIPGIWEKLMAWFHLELISQKLFVRTQKVKGEYLGPILIGMALGPVFASCSPTYAFILASVLPHSFWTGLIYLTAYSLAMVLTLLAVALTGRSLTKRLGWAVNPNGYFRRGIGILFIIIGVIIIAGWELKVETWAANRLPFDEAHIEQSLLNGQRKTNYNVAQPASGPQVVNDASAFNVQPAAAPELVGLTNWINSGPVSLAGLRGKVVLVDFWTYSCVNCNRAIPYVEKWYQTYHKDGFVVIGVHTPEFAFEHNAANVQAAVKRDGLTYPVALDNDYDTWDAFNNDSWPADYLIDKDGYIRYIGLGEGDYNVTEKAIQSLLGLSSPLQTPVSSAPIYQNQTPETYFGADRQSGYEGSSENVNSQAMSYTPQPADKLDQNSWTLSGEWTVKPDRITSDSSNTQLTFNVAAKDVYVVAGSADGSNKSVQVKLPSNFSGNFGSDAAGGTLNISSSRLYHIVSLPSFASTTVTLTLPAGVDLYTFTFGS